MPPTPQLPAQFPNETGGPIDIRSGLGGSGMAPGLLPERGGPSASTPPPGKSFYEPGQKFVEGGTEPRPTIVYHDVVNMPDELRTLQGVQTLRDQLVQFGIPRPEVLKMQLPEMWNEYVKRVRSQFGNREASLDYAPPSRGGTAGTNPAQQAIDAETVQRIKESVKRRSITKRKPSAG